MKPWTELLLPSQVSFMNEIIAQVPEVGRDAFIGCLQGLADQAQPAKWRWYIVRDGEVSGGTNNPDVAAHFEEDDIVIDTQDNTWDTMQVREIFLSDASDEVDE